MAVLVDNFAPDARPQTGVAAADVVFEALAEGGITRFMAVYTSHDAPVVGPVRSTRLYFNAWAAGIGAVLGHDGGNVDALKELHALQAVDDLNSDRTPSAFWRSSKRVAPHNEYTSTVVLRHLSPVTPVDWSGTRDIWPRKPDAPVADRPGAFALSVQFSYSDYNVRWRYDRAANEYVRVVSGSVQRDAVSHRPVRSRNVVVMFLRKRAAYDPFTPGAVRLATEGTGPVMVYRDGQVMGGTWKKAAVAAPLRWIDDRGLPIRLDHGSVWVEAVAAGSSVTTVVR